jgi:hypothetical protein
MSHFVALLPLGHIDTSFNFEPLNVANMACFAEIYLLGTQEEAHEEGYLWIALLY